MDYEPDTSRYYVDVEVVHSTSSPFSWIKTIRRWFWPSSDGGVMFRKDEQTEPFGPFVTVYERKKEDADKPFGPFST